MKCEKSALRRLDDRWAAEMLSCDGLPDDHLLFRACPADADGWVQSADGRSWLRLGDIGPTRGLFICDVGGEIADVLSLNGYVWHINQSLYHFVASVAAFDASYPFCETSNDLDEAASAASGFEQDLMRPRSNCL
ncbi:hypothetical protein Cci01nite_61150 [Catellatospora citrea]|uniref:Uncharacterized protein n=1 Tax=Catellatospora citrea TaxID=53366 RepID=A0A8J3P286_9ACTN|nr:hypothetical protein Cci01nite_61150 [Catellatospora citrea]